MDKKVTGTIRNIKVHLLLIISEICVTTTSEK